MIHKMYALYDFIPHEIIKQHYNEYGLNMEPREISVIVLLMQLNCDSVQFYGTDLVQYDVTRNLESYFYRSASAMAVSPFPTLYISDVGLKDDDKNYSVESKDFGKFLRILANIASIESEVKPLLEFIKTNGNDIITRISEYTSVSNKNPYLLTIKIDNKYIGESNLFNKIRENLRQAPYADSYTLGSKKVVGKNQVCSICATKTDEVWGYVSIFNFYTSKTEFAPIAGGFRKEKAHKNYPVCKACTAKMEKLKPIIEHYMNFRFCGFSYFMIPEFVTSNSSDIAQQEIIDILIDPNNVNSTRIGQLSLGKSKQILEDDARYIFNILAEASNQANYTMLFYERNNAEFKILLTIENVFPKQFNAIFDAKTKADNHAIFKAQKGIKKGELIDLGFQFEILKDFFPIQSRMHGDFSKHFLEIVNSIFLQKRISYDFLMNRIVQTIRQRFVNEEYYELTVKKSILLLKFMYYLGIINKTTTPSDKEVKVNAKSEKFFNEHSEFFSSNAKKAVFLMGALCQLLMNITFQERQSSPFRKHLNGLKLNPGLIQKLFPEMIEKLEQYDKNYYKSMEEDIAKLLLDAKLTNMSHDEISFMFVMGMTLHKEIKQDEPKPTDE